MKVAAIVPIDSDGFSTVGPLSGHEELPITIEVARHDLSHVRVLSSAGPSLENGQTRIRVEAFALSTNNITYAVFGDAMRYWDFFPVDAEAAGLWGRVPVWGFGEVVESRSPFLETGERLYGYYPMGAELVITAGRSDTAGVSDVAPHRAEMAGAYSRYVRCAADPLYRADRERHHMLLYPLFFTSFLIDDFLLDNDGFGADQIVVSSASSKTAIGVAHLANQRGARVVGLTSAANRAFTESLAVYDVVHTYDDLSDVEIRPSVYVDITGNRDVLHAVHTRLEGVLGHSMAVGGTHWDHEAAAGLDVPEPSPAFFFAPLQISKRRQDWGAGELDRRLGTAWDHYVTWTNEWIDFRDARGDEAVIAVYQELLAGHPDPRAGFICALPAALG
jgi:NADPH:quinone reductase-like Zn-dependent oxidoreductase